MFILHYKCQFTVSSGIAKQALKLLTKDYQPCGTESAPGGTQSQQVNLWNAQIWPGLWLYSCLAPWWVSARDLITCLLNMEIEYIIYLPLFAQ